MKKHTILNLALASCVIGLLAGCASTKITNREQNVSEQLPLPGHIWIYDFVATPADVPADSVLAGEPDLDSTPQTAEEIAAGRELGAQIASELIEQVRAMGLPAAAAGPGTVPQVNDIVIRGYLLSIKEGSAAKRVAIGFGAGASELNTLVDGFQVTPQGQRKLASGTVNAGGAKTPGAALGAATFLATSNPAGLIVGTGMKIYGEASGKSKVSGRAKATATELAKEFKKRFKRQGWIN
jgi:hypothetical protein